MILADSYLFPLYYSKSADFLQGPLSRFWPNEWYAPTMHFRMAFFSASACTNRVVLVMLRLFCWSPISGQHLPLWRWTEGAENRARSLFNGGRQTARMGLVLSWCPKTAFDLSPRTQTGFRLFTAVINGDAVTVVFVSRVVNSRTGCWMVCVFYRGVFSGSNVSMDAP